MKRIVLATIIMGFVFSNIHAQMQMTSGNLSIAATPAPNAFTKVGISFSSTSGSGTSYNYALSVANNPTASSLNYYGVYGVSLYPSSVSYSRTCGVFGEAGNATTGYNYGIFGQLVGSNNGAGIVGVASGMGCPSIGGNYAGYFNGNVYSSGNMYATSFVPSSDKRLKKEITPMSNNTFNKLSQLNAVTYKFKTRQELRADGSIQNDTNKSDTANGKYANYTHFGFIAQDVQKVFPNLVYEKDDGFLGINYTELIPLIIEDLKLQETTINQLNETITSLQQQVNNCCSNGNLQKPDGQSGINTNNDGNASPVLYQNNPNPFSQQTQIKCFIPENAMTSILCVYNMEGTQLQKIQINGKNEQTVTLQGSELKAGMYMYSLIIDGKVIDTKKMILTD